MTGTQPAPSPPPRYQNLRELGSGAFGIVYRADDSLLGRPVALKVMHHAPAPEVVERLRREAGSLAKIRHRNVVQVFDAGVMGDRPFLVMELLDGTPLERLRPARDWVSAMLDVASGLEAIHAAGLVHRDLKPANILLDRENRAVILDFGLVLVDGRTRLTETGTVLGTMAFMAPELLQGRDTTPAADWFSWGASFYFLIERAPPRTEAQQVAILAGRPPSPIGFRRLDPAAPLARTLLAAMDDDPARRPRSREDVERLLAPDTALFEAPGAGPDAPTREAPAAPRPSAPAPEPSPDPTPVQLPRPVSAPDRPAAAAGLVLLGLAALAGAWSRHEPPDPSLSPAPPPILEPGAALPLELPAALAAETAAARYLGWDAPGRWVARPAMATFLAWARTGSPARSLPPRLLEELRELDAQANRRGLPGPCGPFLELEDWPTVARRAQAETEAFFKTYQADFDDGGVVVEGPDSRFELGKDGLLGQTDLRRVLHMLVLRADSRDALFRWVAPGADAMRRMIHAGVRAADADPAGSEALVSALQATMDYQSALLASGWIATDPQTYLGHGPRSPVAAFLAGDAAARCIGIVGSCGIDQGPWRVAAKGWLEEARVRGPIPSPLAELRVHLATIMLLRNFPEDYPPAQVLMLVEPELPGILSRPPEFPHPELLAAVLQAWSRTGPTEGRRDLLARIRTWILTYRNDSTRKLSWNDLDDPLGLVEARFRQPALPEP